MKAKIKNILVPDSPDYTPQGYKPEEADNFSVFWQLLIGSAESNASESFNIEICTPQWLSQKVGSGGMISGHGYIIVSEYDPQKIINYLKIRIENISSPAWDEIAQKISRIALWEFADYNS